LLDLRNAFVSLGSWHSATELRPQIYPPATEFFSGLYSTNVAVKLSIISFPQQMPL
jgi:hypothetical protein